MSVSVKIGVLNVQGAVSEHVDHIKRVDAEPILVKHADDLIGLHGLIIPGGESTTIGKLIRKYGLFDPIIESAQQGMPIFGTCAGMILLAKQIEGHDEPHLALMDVVVNRNSFGRQRESFEADILIRGVSDNPFPAVFIRAPHVVNAGEQVDVLATLDEKIVAVQQGQLLASAFHPELTDDTRMHSYFKGLAIQYQSKS
ncbi:Pyridoxal 5'-phosphate synthase subunit PdxT [Acidibacillus sp. S0AB]|uniref:Pyridoxal 5'-phosphate synthase subunit PdxT n=1 Tax=Sulfoacidibacillus ferrooxidans TaxID=2005001 RepID=A0A9X1V7G5_9BACL|nr:pyridoxal 5'-phosphate synthase glutaminase subunit PdxT [Sulfoacidibacillus ferrooxidans]MCI0182673.1 Pyridoxal 5'-phosphate synthase subunit PdxT [Sulfoacidibacillus ferrooxidans]